MTHFIASTHRASSFAARFFGEGSVGYPSGTEEIARARIDGGRPFQTRTGIILGCAVAGCLGSALAVQAYTASREAPDTRSQEGVVVSQVLTEKTQSAFALVPAEQAASHWNVDLPVLSEDRPVDGVAGLPESPELRAYLQGELEKSGSALNEDLEVMPESQPEGVALRF